MEIYLKFAEIKRLGQKAGAARREYPRKRTKPKSRAAAESVLPAAAQPFVKFSAFNARPASPGSFPRISPAARYIYPPGTCPAFRRFNELVRLEQCRRADLTAEKADALIPCQQLEHIVQRGTLHAVDICLYQFPRRLPHPARTDSVGQGQQQPRFVGQYALLALPCGLPKSTAICPSFSSIMG